MFSKISKRNKKSFKTKILLPQITPTHEVPQECSIYITTPTYKKELSPIVRFPLTHKDIETNTDFTMIPELNTVKIPLIHTNSSKLKQLPSCSHSPIPKSLTPLVPQSFKFILKNSSFFKDFSKTNSMKGQIKYPRPCQTPLGRRLGIRSKYYKDIIVNSLLKKQ